MTTRWKWLIAAIILIGIVGIVIIASIYSEMKSTAKEMYSPRKADTSTIRQQPVNIATKKEPFSALILGVDEREGDVGRSDTMIVLTVNPTLQTTQMLSIPRDTYTEMIGRGFKDKINHAHAFGGTEMSIRTVENLLAIPIDYVAKINMESFVDIIEIVGGITVDNALEFHYEGDHFPIGKLVLDGEMALKYVRMRYEDPSGDFGRQNRQKQVIQGVMKESLSLHTLWNYPSIFKVLEENVEISLAFDELLQIRKNYATSLKTIEQLYMNEGTSMIKNGIYYYLPNNVQLHDLQNKLQEHMEIQGWNEDST